jgi:branched-chain amino acid transport system permease protein
LTALEYLPLALLDGLASGLILALVALGLSLAFGVMKIVNLAHGEFYMLGAVVCFLAARSGLGFWAGVLIAPLAVGLLALAVDLALLRRLEYRLSPTIVATFGLLLVLQQAALAIIGPAPRSVDPPLSLQLVFQGFSYSGYKILAAASATAVALGAWGLVALSDTGLRMRAVQQNRSLAEALGIDSGRLMTLGLMLSGALAGLAGALTAPVRQVHFLMGLDALVWSFLVVVLGGVGRIWGTVAAAVGLGILESLAALFFAPTLSRVVSMLVVLAYLAARRLSWHG